MSSEVLRNAAYRPFFESIAKYNILRGGSGSGKSYAVADDVILRTLEPVLSRTIVARKVAATLRQSCFRLIEARIADMGLASAFRVNRTEMTFTAGRNEIILVGLDDAAKLKSVFDPTDAWVEEADQTTQDDFEEIDRRIRTQTGRKPKITLSFNPTSVYSWLKRYWYDNDFVNGDCYKLTTTYKDNRFLDPAYMATIERLQETNPSAYRVYGLGEWGIVEGVVFDRWNTEGIGERAKLSGYGLDFGFSNDPTALIAVWESGDDIWLDETIYQTGLTNQDISQLMQSLGHNRHTDIVADSAEPKSIEEIYRAGWNIRPCVKGADSVRAGIQLMKAKRLHVTPRSTNLQRELSSYAWKTDKNGNFLPEPIDAFNHAIDAARYFIQSRLNRAKAGDARGLGF